MTPGGATAGGDPGLSGLFRTAVRVEPGELPAVGWSFLYFFCLLGGYYILRPVRDTMGIAGGVDQLQWLFTGTFVAMLLAVPLYGWVTSRYRRSTFLPVVYGFFILSILAFYLLFSMDTDEVVLARSFFIWTSVFNLFVVSVFWSFMADVYSSAQAKRLFGVIAAGGTLGAICGPLATAILADGLGTVNLLPLSALALSVALLCVDRLRRWDSYWRRQSAEEVSSGEVFIGGRTLDGVRRLLTSPYLLGISLFILLYTSLSTFLYFQQAHIVEAAFATDGERTRVFALIDFAVNSLTIIVQLFVTSRLIRYLGLPVTLTLLPVIVVTGFLVLALLPVFLVLGVFQVLRRAGNYAVTRPAREMLFTVLPRTDKYKSKNVIDTVVYRGGDAVSAWFFAGLMALGLGVTGTALMAAVMAVFWGTIGYWLGRRHMQLGVEAVRPQLAISRAGGA